MRRSANGFVKRNKTPQKNNNVENDDGGGKNESGTNYICKTVERKLGHFDDKPGQRKWRRQTVEA